MPNSDKTSKLILLAVVAGLLFNFPLVELAAKPRLLLGMPQLYLFLFLAWLVVILLTRRLVNQPGQRRLPADKTS